jgi:DNA-binding CsgD family transcriptional regulator
MTKKYPKQQIQDMLNSGMRQYEIAKALGANRGTISALVHRNGLHDPHSPERAVQVQTMLDQGMRQVEIAAALGINQRTVSAHIKRNGLRNPNARWRRAEPVIEWLPSRPIVVHVPQSAPRMVKTGVPFRMSLTPLSEYLAAGRQTSAPRDA